ncbi:unnamed protein product [Onchocerca flexuosa]|uniref:CNNM transmembrane domain-containing protein n=1 Tax=Onchocerca flexuosa TaxID=387005 RepID=A0A183I4L9_9BILA|nr:unnamed protein product [Onchocerca flexuosa]
MNKDCGSFRPLAAVKRSRKMLGVLDTTKNSTVAGTSSAVYVGERLKATRTYIITFTNSKAIWMELVIFVISSGANLVVMYGAVFSTTF